MSYSSWLDDGQVGVLEAVAVNTLCTPHTCSYMHTCSGLGHWCLHTGADRGESGHDDHLQQLPDRGLDDQRLDHGLVVSSEAESVDALCPQMHMP